MRATPPPERSSDRDPAWVVIDVETTGLSPREHRIAEVAVILLDLHGKPLGEASTLVDPDGELGPVEGHGIRPEHVAGAPRFDAIAGWLQQWLTGHVVVGHNLLFTTAFLDEEFRRSGIDMPHVPIICTMTHAPRYLPSISGRTLDQCCAAAGIEIGEPRSALTRARAAAALFARFLSHRTTLPSPWMDNLAKARRISWPTTPVVDFQPLARPGADDQPAPAARTVHAAGRIPGIGAARLPFGGGGSARSVTVAGSGLSIGRSNPVGTTPVGTTPSAAPAQPVAASPVAASPVEDTSREDTELLEAAPAHEPVSGPEPGAGHVPEEPTGQPEPAIEPQAAAADSTPATASSSGRAPVPGPQPGSGSEPVPGSGGEAVRGRAGVPDAQPAGANDAPRTSPSPAVGAAKPRPRPWPAVGTATPPPGASAEGKSAVGTAKPRPTPIVGTAAPAGSPIVGKASPVATGKASVAPAAVLTAPPSGRASVSAAAAAAAAEEFVAEVIDSAPRQPDESGPVTAYLGALDAAVSDRVLSFTEAIHLKDLAAALAIFESEQENAHRTYLRTLAATAWTDHQITEDERTDLLAVGKLLDVPEHEVEKVINEAKPRPKPVSASVSGTAQVTPAAAAWYPDPYGVARLRWWDGSIWTSHTHL